MYGAKVNRLNLISVNRDNSSSENILWTRSGNLGPDWRHGQVQFKPDSASGGNYAFAFEGKLVTLALCASSVKLP